MLSEVQGVGGIEPEGFMAAKTDVLRRVDPILASVLQRRFKSITQEMGLTLLRTTRSPILNEARDFVTGLYDARGRMLEQTEYIPILAFALQPVCQYLLEYFGDQLYPGDVILHNDVFTRGNQLADVAAFKPVFHGDKLVAWAACKGHQADIGGALPGGYNPQAREIWQEGLRITPVKVYEKGRLRKDVWDMIFANVRTQMVAEDVRAQVGGCVVGERGIEKLIRAYGLDALETHIEYILKSTEGLMRKEISAIPDGAYTGESYVHYDGVSEGSKPGIRVAVTVRGDEITFDFAGTDGQTPGFVNAPYASTVSGTLLTFLMLVNPDLPHNDGMLRPIHIIVPEGSILNARFPAATTFGNHLSDQVSEAIFAALSGPLPQRVTAAWNRKLSASLSGYAPRKKRPYFDVLFLSNKGGSGGTYGSDGYDHIGLICCAGGILAQDYEMFELHDPHFLLQHEYKMDSAGAGHWRGGLGVETIFRLGGKGTIAAVNGDGDQEGAFALFDGKPGSLNRIELLYPNGSRYRPKNKEVIIGIPAGTLWEQEAGGGGGYGDPYLRPVDIVRAEVVDGLVSIGAAREEYGVVISPDTLEVDQEETRKLHQRRPCFPRT